jgi:protein gp37
MSKDSAIGWTHHSFNCWWGCFKVSDGCKNCYAETFSKRTGRDIWGPPATTERRLFGDVHWREPLKWNAAAEAAGERQRVFCASMADVFEDHPAVWESRQRLWDLIAETPALDWLLLTKRPENVMGMVPMDWTQYGFPSNVWVGTSVEHQAAADERIPHLLGIPAAVRFLSCEPLLGRVELFRYDEDEGALRGPGVVVSGGMTVGTDDYPPEGYDDSYPGIDWVIVGGESGPKHRPMDLPAALDIIDQCKAAGISVYVKQDSGKYPGRQGRIPDAYWLHEYPRTAAPAGSGAPNADGGA